MNNEQIVMTGLEYATLKEVILNTTSKTQLSKHPKLHKTKRVVFDKVDKVYSPSFDMSLGFTRENIFTNNYKTIDFVKDKVKAVAYLKYPLRLMIVYINKMKSFDNVSYKDYATVDKTFKSYVMKLIFHKETKEAEELLKLYNQGETNE